MPKKYEKITIDGVDYHQIRKDKDGESLWWKNQPQTPPSVIASGLHVINGVPKQTHYDFYDNRKEIGKKYVNEKIGGVMLGPDGIFVTPANKVLVLGQGKPTFISIEEFNKNRDKYKIIADKDGMVN